MLSDVVIHSSCRDLEAGRWNSGRYSRCRREVGLELWWRSLRLRFNPNGSSMRRIGDYAMTSTTTQPDAFQPEAETAIYLFDDWFDPIASANKIADITA